MLSHSLFSSLCYCFVCLGALKGALFLSLPAWRQIWPAGRDSIITHVGIGFPPRTDSRMKLTTQLVSFITLCVITAMAMVMLGGVFSFRQLGFELQEKKVDALVEVLDRNFDSQTESAAMVEWLPSLLRSAHVISLDVYRGEQKVYGFQNLTQAEPDDPLVDYRLTLPRHAEFEARLRLERPFKEFEYSMEAMFGISFGVFIVVFGLWFSIRWLREQLRGAELLNHRAELILSGSLGKLNHDPAEEWPASASKAIDYLLAELADARKERSRFDSFIRSNAFVDKVTGTGNRIFFDNRLESAIRDSAALNGGMLLIELVGLDELEGNESAMNEVLQEASLSIGAFVRKHAGALQARYAAHLIAVLLPNQGESELVDAATQLHKSLLRLHWPEEVEGEIYVGAVCYRSTDTMAQVQEEAELALKSAHLQGGSGWFLFEKLSPDEENTNKGTVRWRTLLTRRIEERAVRLYSQPVMQGQGQLVLQQELLARLDDEQGHELLAGVFMPMAEKSGMLLPFDRMMVEQVLSLLQRLPPDAPPVSLNLCAQSLLNREFQRWLFFSLFQLPRSRNEQLILECSEAQITRYFEALKKPLRSLRMLGVRLTVDHAGQDVVSTQYIKEFDINFLKLHPSLVRDIHLRQVNQMAVRSLIGGCANTHTRVLAVGVESAEEWHCLRHLGVHAGQGIWFAGPAPMVIPDAPAP